MSIAVFIMVRPWRRDCRGLKLGRVSDTLIISISSETALRWGLIPDPGFVISKVPDLLGVSAMWRTLVVTSKCPVRGVQSVIEIQRLQARAT